MGVDGRSEEESTLVCHTRSSTALEIREVCASLRWYLCEVGLMVMEFVIVVLVTADALVFALRCRCLRLFRFSLLFF